MAAHAIKEHRTARFAKLSIVKVWSQIAIHLRSRSKSFGIRHAQPATCHDLAADGKVLATLIGRSDDTGMTLEPLHPIQAERLRTMTPAEKWEVAKGLLRTARETRRSGLALRHPEWSPEQIERELAREITRART